MSVADGSRSYFAMHIRLASDLPWPMPGPLNAPMLCSLIRCPDNTVEALDSVVQRLMVAPNPFHSLSPVHSSLSGCVCNDRTSIGDR